VSVFKIASQSSSAFLYF